MRCRYLTTTLLLACALPAALRAEEVRTGPTAFGGWTEDAPGVRRQITVSDLPAPYATPSARNQAEVVRPPRTAGLRTLPGFTVTKLIGGLDGPRQVRAAPNGDLFVSESGEGRIRILRLSEDGSRVERSEIFAQGLKRPFGIAFYPPGPSPEFVYVGDTGAVVRYPYRNGDLAARGQAELVTDRVSSGGQLTGGGHWTRDVAFTPDGSRLLVSVGSRSNYFPDAEVPNRDELAALEAKAGAGALWGSEEGRASVLSFRPDGSDPRTFANGIRNCVSLAIQPATGTPWCAVNERDGLGDNLVPDYVTSVEEGGYYGWPWFYLGGHQDPRHAGKRADLRDRVKVPDVLIQAHSAALGITFYEGGSFPAAYQDQAFVALHGSWNREARTGYKIVRLIMQDGRPTGAYEDFVTGFVTPDGEVWGRPVGITVTRDGSLVFADDGGDALWRISYQRQQAAR